jgi:hypothetical protein
MWPFKTGDLIAKTHIFTKKPLKIGLVVEHNIDTFLIKWVWLDKDFFMEKEGDIFMELNKTFLLGTAQVHRSNMEANLSLLNSKYSYGKKEKNPLPKGVAP